MEKLSRQSTWTFYCTTTEKAIDPSVVKILLCLRTLFELHLKFTNRMRFASNKREFLQRRWQLWMNNTFGKIHFIFEKLKVVFRANFWAMILSLFLPRATSLSFPSKSFMLFTMTDNEYFYFLLVNYILNKMIYDDLWFYYI